jgi:hypothetical protein
MTYYSQYIGLQVGYSYLYPFVLILSIDNGSLSDTYREVCEMKYILHMKEREIAQELGLSEKNVNARIFRGKQVLRKMIQESYGYDK